MFGAKTATSARQGGRCRRDRRRRFRAWTADTCVAWVDRSDWSMRTDRAIPGDLGDETRGVRSSYGDRGMWAELWTRWANQAIDRWMTFDAEWGRAMRCAVLQHRRLRSSAHNRSLSPRETRSCGQTARSPFRVAKVETLHVTIRASISGTPPVAVHEPWRASSARGAMPKCCRGVSSCRRPGVDGPRRPGIETVPGCRT